MSRQFSPRLLDVDLTAMTLGVRRFHNDLTMRYIGGSGMNARILSDLTGADTDPLGPANVLLFSTGPLVGTVAPSSGRHHVTSKSPLTGILGEADVGGYFGQTMRRAGFEGIIIRGTARRPVCLIIEDAAGLDDKAAHDAVRIEDASSFWGHDTISADEMIKAAYGADLEVALIGQAGERMAGIASIMHDGKSSRAAGRCGLGAVMGSKHLKAIAIRKTRNQVFVADSDGLKTSARGQAKQLVKNAAALGRFGTAAGMEAIEAIGDLPINNWRDGEFKDGARKLSGVTMAETILTGRFGCASCPIRCGREVGVEDHRYGTFAGAGPEYETLASLGSMLLLDDLEAVSYAGYLCNAYGLDTISTGSVIAFAIEAFERGYLTEKDFGGWKPERGSADTLMHIIGLIGLRHGIGELLGEGVRAAAKQLRIPADDDMVIHVKGLELPMHDPRAYNSLGLGYATSNRGACHLQGFSHPFERAASLPELGYAQPIDRYGVEGKGVFLAKLQDLMCVLDSIKACKFLVTSGVSLVAVAEWVAAATGWDIALEDLMAAGERIFNLKRMYNVKCGISRKDDTLPTRILTQRRGSGGSAENLPRLEPMLDEYYVARGWSAEGIPTESTLSRLELVQNVDSP